MTPREVDIYQRGVARRRNDDWKRALWSAWHVEAFARSKRLPHLKKVLAQLDRVAEGRKPGKTVDEIFHAIEAAHAILTAMTPQKQQPVAKGAVKGRKDRKRG